MRAVRKENEPVEFSREMSAAYDPQGLPAERVRPIRDLDVSWRFTKSICIL